MRRLLTGILLVSATLSAQAIVDPAKLPDSLKNLNWGQVGQSIRCDVTPIKPALNFGFRFGAGYVAHIPLNQYAGPGHKLALMTRITPQGGEPVYLMNVLRLPNIPTTKLSLEVIGNYLLGEGRYRVEWMLFDEKKRVCRKDWSVKAELRQSERKVRVA